MATQKNVLQSSQKQKTQYNLKSNFVEDKQAEWLFEGKAVAFISETWTTYTEACSITSLIFRAL